MFSTCVVYGQTTRIIERPYRLSWKRKLCAIALFLIFNSCVTDQPTDGPTDFATVQYRDSFTIGYNNEIKLRGVAIEITG